MKMEFAQNPAYVSFERNLRSLHELIAAGEGESEKADAVRDAMSADYRSLSAHEEDRLNGLSEDLYSLTEPPTVNLKEGFPGDAALAKDILRAREHYDWAALLRLLRKLEPQLPASQIAFQRYQAYARLGHPETAYLFLKFAADLEPNDVRKQHLLLDFSPKAGHGAEALDQAERLLRESDTPAPLVISAAHIRLEALRETTGEAALPAVREIAGALNRAMHQVEALKGSPLSVLILGYSNLGFCREKLGDVDGAMDAFDQALKLDPKSDALRISRGLVLAKYDMNRAAREFALAAESGSHLFHPYLFLAPYELGLGHWEESLRYAEQLRARTQDPAIEAEAQNWSAIALFELGRPWPIVEALFHQALLLDPLNPRIAENFQRCRRENSVSSALRSVVAWSRPGAGGFSGSRQLPTGRCCRVSSENLPALDPVSLRVSDPRLPRTGRPCSESRPARL